MESNRPLSQGGVTAGRALEIPPGARVVLVYDQYPAPLAATQKASAAVGER
jgi:hypothetical protein